MVAVGDEGAMNYFVLEVFALLYCRKVVLVPGILSKLFNLLDSLNHKLLVRSVRS